MLYACYDLIPLDVVMELSWRHGLNDFTMVCYHNFILLEFSLTDPSAIHDQLHEPADFHHCGTQARQRGAEVKRPGRNSGRQCPYLGSVATHADPRTCRRWRRIALHERDHSSAYRIRKVLGLEMTKKVESGLADVYGVISGV